MKNKLLSITLILLLAAVITGCDAPELVEVQSIPYEKPEDAQEQTDVADATSAESAQEEANTSQNATVEGNANIEVADSDSLTFADLAKLRFEFSSGAGGWSEEFTIEKDGYFTGNFHDSDMGDTGEGYENGTFYSSSYSGHFTDLTKIDEYTYEMKLADISYKETAGTEEIIDNVRYIYIDTYCLGGTDTFKIYLPGTPISELSEDVRIWLSLMNENETELKMIAIVDETNNYGIYSVDRPEPLEDAQMTFNTYKDSYDYYGELLLEAVTTLEMVEYTGKMYELSDECLNYIWNLIRYNVDEDKYKEILAEQREWIAEKEASAKESSSQYEGGSFAAVDYNDILATLTIKRCEELIEYLK